MGSFINYIITFYKTYTSFDDLYIKVFSVHLSFFDFSIACVWFIIFLGLFINYFIQEYSLKIVILWILKRIFFAIFLGYSFYFFSNASYCDTELNRGIQSGFVSNQTTKYVVITTIAVTGFILIYKYGPCWYTDIKSYTSYKNFFDKQQKYEINYKAYQEYLQASKKAKLDIFYVKSLIKKYDTFIDFFIQSNLVLSDNIQNLMNDSKLYASNLVLGEYKDYFSSKVIISTSSNSNIENEYIKNLDLFYKNYLENLEVFRNLKNSTKKYKFNEYEFNILMRTQEEYHNNILQIINLYHTEIFPLFEHFNYLINNDSNLNSSDVDLLFDNSKLTLLTNLDDLYKLHFKLSNEILVQIKNVETLCLLDMIDLYPLESLSKIKKPFKPFNINIDSMDSLEGLKFVGINLGYSIFYPILYCSNKIFGTVNPLSSKLFKESISYLISLFKVF